MASQNPAEMLARMLRAWHLSILRFAVTRDNADRLAIFAAARDIDGLGRQHENQSFDFFRETSSKLSIAILNRDEAADAMLRQYLSRIDDNRLRRALAAALEIELPTGAAEKRSRATSSLWEGLPSRGIIRS